KRYKVLGDPRFGKTDQVLDPQMAERDNEQGWLSLNGMAKTGEAQYEDYFLSLAGKENTPARTDAIIHYADSHYRNGEVKEAFDFLNTIFETDTLSANLRSLAVHKMAEVDPERSAPALNKAFAMQEEEFPMAAAHGLVFLKGGQYNQLVSSIEGTTPKAKADAIRTLTRSGWEGSAQLGRSGLADPDTVVL